ncbi:hypothetical protein SARC_15253, partial [Sphaeroforma arctica JP610]
PAYDLWAAIDGEGFGLRLRRFVTTKFVSSPHVLRSLSAISGLTPNGLTAPLVYWILNLCGLSSLAVHDKILPGLIENITSHRMSAALHVCAPPAQ